MKTSKLMAETRESKFLKVADFEKPVLWTIHGVEKVNIAKEGADPEYKWGLTFQQSEKPLVLNFTNIQILEAVLGDDTETWTGKPIVVYVDANVMYGGKMVGGVRVRAPKPGTPAPKPVEVLDTEIGF